MEEGIMLWEIEIRPRGANGIVATARGYLLEGDLSRQQAEQLLTGLLVDPLAESGTTSELNSVEQNGLGRVTVLLKPGVMDPVALSVVDAANDLGINVDSVRTFRRYYLAEGGS